MYGSVSYGGSSYGDLGKPSEGNSYFQINSDSLAVNETTFIRDTVKVLTDIPILVSVLLKFLVKTAFVDSFAVASTMVKQVGKVLSESLLLSEVFATVAQFARTISDTINAISTISVAGLFRRTVTDTLSVLDGGITRLTGKLLSLTISVSSVIRRYLNGLLVNPWTKVVKTVATFLKIAKPTATYTKTAKPSNTGIWTKVGKPY